MKLILNFISGMLAGFAIGFGGLLNIAITDNLQNIIGKFLGAVMFSVGLLSICIFKLKLYTGQVSRLFTERTLLTVIELGLMLIGNMIGASIFGTGIHYIYKADKIESIVMSKSPSNWEEWIKTLLNGIYCGLCVQYAVTSFKRCDRVTGIFLLVFYVSLFVYNGFDHCVANMFYIAIAQKWKWNSMLSILLCIITNAIGTIPILLYERSISLMNSS